MGILSSMIKRYLEAAIYSLKCDSWRTVEDFKPGVSYYSEAKFVNHKIHLITSPRCGCGWRITSIDMVNDKWGKLELPSYNKGGHLKLGVLGSDLPVLCNNDERTYSDVWVMKECGVKASLTNCIPSGILRIMSFLRPFHV